ncbi:hypothetical protein [Dyella subtropica]|uniref:hypothetical protein n=1 Tax=Dyella subtropica TaxID=2992127 RepID=UPI002255BE70|nr:hypothetical protein [Dyella subtropica]
MKRSIRQRLMLIAGALVLVGLAGWQWRDDRMTDPGTLLSLDPTTIHRIDLELPGVPAEHYTKRDGHWQASDGASGPADDGRLTELAATATAAVLSWRPASDFDPAKIGLAPPAAVLTLDGQRLEFGETSVTGPQRYVRAGDRIALISVRYTPRPAPANAAKVR